MKSDMNQVKTYVILGDGHTIDITQMLDVDLRVIKQ